MKATAFGWMEGGIQVRRPASPTQAGPGPYAPVPNAKLDQGHVAWRATRVRFRKRWLLSGSDEARLEIPSHEPRRATEGRLPMTGSGKADEARK